MNGNKVGGLSSATRSCGIKAFFQDVQSKITSSQYSYLVYAFVIPTALTFLVYLANGIHPFGDGSVLVLDLNGQYVYFFESLRNAVYGEGSFLYTFSRALGGEYMGIYAYYLASPLSYIVCLFPAHRILDALLTIILIKSGLCGLSFGFYLHKHSKNPNKVVIVVFSVMYALCSFAVVHQNNIMWTDAIIWLPIIAYAIEQIIINRKYKLFVISLSLTIMSNYYIGYMVCIFCVVYFIYFHLAHGKDVRNPYEKKYHTLKSCLNFVIFSLIAVAIAGFIILAAYYSLSFGKNEFSNPSWSLYAKFNVLDFLTKFLPGTYDTVRPEGLPFVYCGLLVLIAVPIYFMSRQVRIREKLASLALIVFFVLCMIASPLDLIWHGFQEPNWLNHRYSFMLCFVLLVLAYKGIGNLRKCSEKFILAICTFIVLFVAVCEKLSFRTYIDTGRYDYNVEKLETFYTVWLTIIVTVLLLAVLCLMIRTTDKRMREGMTAVLACIICVEMFCNALAIVSQFDNDVVYSNYSEYTNYISGLRPVVADLKEYDPSFYRMEKNLHRKKNDNMALSIRGLSNSTSTLNSSAIKFLNNMGYASRSHLSLYAGGNPVSDSLLGIKYIIDKKDTDAVPPIYNKALTSGNYDIYQNPYVMSLAYGVSEDVKNFDFDKYSTQFKKLNALVGAIGGYDNTPEIFKAVDGVTETYHGCENKGTFTNKNIAKTAEKGAGTVTYSFVATQTAEYYFHTPSNSPSECVLKINGKSLGKYLGSESQHIFSIGRFEEGEEVNVVIQLGDDPLNIIGGIDYVWYIDEQVFDDVFSRINAMPQWQIDNEYTDDHLLGTITTSTSSTTVMTTIPYDEGWRIYLDGEQIEAYQTLNALIAFDINTSGDHTLEMRYMPSLYRTGIVISIIGIAVFVIICAVDFILKRVHKSSNTNGISTSYWRLDDFDNTDVDDNTDENLSIKEAIKRMLPFKNNKDGET